MNEGIDNEIVFVGIKELSKILGLSMSFLRQAADDSEIPWVRSSGARRFLPQQVVLALNDRLWAEMVPMSKALEPVAPGA